MVRSCRLQEVEEILADMDTTGIADDIAETDEDMQLIISGWYVFIPELNLYLREGVVCIWDEEEKLFMPDFAVTVIYDGNLEEGDSGSKDSVVNASGESTQAFFPTDALYYEQDGFVVTLANWLNGSLPMEQIEQLKCDLVMPDEAIYKKEELGYEVFN